MTPIQFKNGISKYFKKPPLPQGWRILINGEPMVKSDSPDSLMFYASEAAATKHINVAFKWLAAEHVRSLKETDPEYQRLESRRKFLENELHRCAEEQIKRFPVAALYMRHSSNPEHRQLLRDTEIARKECNKYSYDMEKDVLTEIRRLNAKTKFVTVEYC